MYCSFSLKITCYCHYGWSGPTCYTRKLYNFSNFIAFRKTFLIPALWPMVCDNVNCSGNGECVFVPGKTAYTCNCNYGWTGANCESETHSCLPCWRKSMLKFNNQVLVIAAQTYCGKEGSWWCKNGGDCVDNPDGTYYCNCLSNYYEERCRGTSLFLFFIAKPTLF